MLNAALFTRLPTRYVHKYIEKLVSSDDFFSEDPKNQFASFKSCMVEFFFDLVPSARNQLLNENVDFKDESFTNGSSPLYKHRVLEHVKKVLNGEQTYYHSINLYG